MQNIRVFIYRQDLRQLDSQIFEELISKPHLHTLSTYSDSRSTVSYLSAPRGLRHLICISQPSPGWSLDSAPNLESLAVVGPGCFHGSSSIPWASLRDLEICVTENPTAVLGSFAAWKNEL